jgi:hypothetical protein
VCSLEFVREARAHGGGDRIAFACARGLRRRQRAERAAVLHEIAPRIVAVGYYRAGQSRRTHPTRALRSGFACAVSQHAGGEALIHIRQPRTGDRAATEPAQAGRSAQRALRSAGRIASTIAPRICWPRQADAHGVHEALSPAVIARAVPPEPSTPRLHSPDASGFAI